ncbi:HD-GYP domain-containing protein [Thiorhodovibrio frisius]|uniref:HD-GYP domain-containing protein n=1 Tax=Thiorhodovibrio frisius TaxID=631362 RepID=H8Z4Z2_9GAMM|nr:HD domain-containing phosphohydrolase [Thiorhodovibrio frisius]EIC20399.1 HD-GYP domain-containing protein [Thiorhodovibrio frisius]WPL21140.1 Cyclic di-GMP phosphodiesterase response regulator RpfG [Thiorhodovibrio frisius]
MALTEVAVERLRVGVFIHLDTPWMQHPFLTSKFKLRSEKQLKVLRSLGVKLVQVDAERSDCAPWEPAEVPPPSPEVGLESALDELAEETLAIAADPDLDAETAALWEEKNQRIRKLKERRARLNQCAKRYTTSVISARKLFPLLESMPGEALRAANELVAGMIDELGADQETTVQLINLKHLEENSYFHAINVVALALVLGRELALNVRDLRLLGLGALFHDLGHQQLPSQILLKKGPFTRPELMLYRRHPAIGLQMAKRMPTLPRPVMEIIGKHHEHLDGSGYPQGLREQDLGMLTRVISIVNRYDNLCNGFAARRGLSPHQAVSLMYAKEKSHYDGQVLSAFISCLGVYPPGTVVRLEDERLAVVTSVNRDDLAKPNVLVYAPDVPKEEAVILDLSEEELGVRESLHVGALNQDQVEYLNVSDKLSYYFEKKKHGRRG